MGPNFRYCSDEYFDCADHTLIFTHVAIEEHLYAAGFEPSRASPRYLPYSFRGRLPPSRALTRRYLRRRSRGGCWASSSWSSGAAEARTGRPRRATGRSPR